MITLRDAVVRLFRLSDWLREAPMLLPFAALAFAGGVTWLGRTIAAVPVGGSIAAAAPDWLVIVWAAVLTLGGALVLAAAPLRWPRTQAAGLILLLVALSITVGASLLLGKYDATSIAAALAAGVTVHLRISLGVIAARKTIIETQEGDET